MARRSRDWNKTLAERNRAYRTCGTRTSYRETDAALTAWKKTPELEFLSEVSSVPLQQALRHQHAAFAGFFAGRARYPRFKNRSSRQSAHARYQRRMARKQPGSANRRKAKTKVAAAHRKVRTARADFLHRTSTGIVGRADVIVVEDLAVAAMVRNRRLARAISDCGWAEFRRQLNTRPDAPDAS